MDISIFIGEHPRSPPEKSENSEKPKRGKNEKTEKPTETKENLPKNTPTYEESRRKEIDGLFEKGAFAFVDISEVPEGTRIFGSRFVDEIKHPGTDRAYEKSRLVIQAYNDPGKELILTQSPTVQRASQRLILALAMTLKNDKKEPLSLYLRDISQAYVQSQTRLICKQSGPKFWDWTVLRSHGPVQSKLSYHPVYIFWTGLFTVYKKFWDWTAYSPVFYFETEYFSPVLDW